MGRVEVISALPIGSGRFQFFWTFWEKVRKNEAVVSLRLAHLTGQVLSDSECFLRGEEDTYEKRGCGSDPFSCLFG